MHHRLRAVLVLLAIGFAVRPAAAAIDISGRWIVTTSFGTICLDIGQTGPSLNGLECVPDGAYSGAIDVDTGVFTLAQPPGCGSVSIEATAAPDGATFSGLLDFSFFHCTFFGCSCQSFDDNVATGARDQCGDGVVNGASGEQCDDGNTLGGDCCSSSCQYEPFGSPCPDDNACTVSETCGGSGVCNVQTAPAGTLCRAATGACDVPESCPGASIACPSDAFVPDGTLCDDGEACTTWDACSGGTCAGAPANCDPLKCYRARDLANPAFAETTVALADEYAHDTAVVRKPLAICNPASLAGAAPHDLDTHLTCYRISEPALSMPLEIESTSALGTVQLQIRKPKLLCLPSAKTILP